MVSKRGSIIDNIVTIVSSPFCQPCSRSHKLLEEWLTEKNSFKLQIVFSIGNSDNDPRTTVARHLHRLNREKKELLPDSLHDWYENKHGGLKYWMEAYPIEYEIDCPELKRHQKWCEEVGIKGTPTIYLNGYQLPAPWQLDDIKYFV